MYTPAFLEALQQLEETLQFPSFDLEDAYALGTRLREAGTREPEPIAVRIVLDSGQASISMIQRKLRVGYARAARLVDMMEEHGYVSGFDGSKPRKVLIKRAQFEALFGDGQGIDAGSDYGPSGGSAPAAPAGKQAAASVSAETPVEEGDAPWDN